MRTFCTIPILLAFLAGCKGTPAYQGQQGDTLATYRVRRLTADLPPTVRVPAVMAAARASLLEHGYAVRESSSTEDAGHISAEPPDAGFLETISVAVTTESSGTHIRIIAQPWGAQARSRAILEGILAKLSM